MKPVRSAFIAGPLEVTARNVLALDLAAKLSSRGHEVHVFCGPGPLLARFGATGAKVTELDLSGSFFWDLPRMPALRREIGAARPHLIHVVDQRLASHGAHLSRTLGVPWLVTATDPVALGRTRPAPAAVLTAGPVVRDEIARLKGADDGALASLPFPLDMSRFPSTNGPFTREVPVIGTLTRLDADAALPDLYGAAKHLVEGGRSLHVLVAGHGPGEEDARRLAREMSIKRQVTVTSVPRDFEPLLATMDVFVLPRHREWHGTDLIQAFAAGRPAVATGVGAVFSLVREGENGHIVPRGDPGALADAISRLLADPERAIRMGRAAREGVEVRFGSEAATERLENVYSELLEDEAWNTTKPR